MSAFSVLLLLATVTSAEYVASFDHGVASGDPRPDSIVLWTRVTPQLSLHQQPAPPSLSLEVSWRVWAADGDEATPKQRGVLTTDGSSDWTVKLIVPELAHSTHY